VRFRSLLAELAGERIVILSTHIVSDVEATATDLAIIARGHLVAHAAPETILDAVNGTVWEWVVPSADLSSIRQTHTICGTLRRSDGLHVRLLSDRQPHPSAWTVPPTLEDGYLHLLAAAEHVHAQ
jgi:ABC-type multidrug transport system ATPase subunit